MIFETWMDAETEYYKTHQCESDDADKEVGNIMNWIEGEGHKVTEELI